MRLIELTIENFGSYKSKTKFDFKDEITVYEGPNGAGKSTMIEGIFYALYGELAKEGVKDVDYVPSGKMATISLRWSYKGEVYLMTRTVNRKGKRAVRTSRLVNLNNNQVLTLEESIEQKIIQMLGKYDTVKNSIYSPQGQLDSLLSSRGETLKGELSTIFGIEKYKELALAWGRLSKRSKEERNELDSLIVKLNEQCVQVPDISIQITQLSEKDEKLEENLNNLDKKKGELEGIQIEKAKIELTIEQKQKKFEEDKKKYDLNKNELENIKESIDPIDLKNPEETSKEREQKLKNITDQLNLLNPFLKEVNPLVEKLNRESGVLQGYSGSITKTRNNLVQKSKENFPLIIEIQELVEFIDQNSTIVSRVQADLNEVKGNIEDIIEFSNSLLIMKKDRQRDGEKVFNFITSSEVIVSPDFNFQDIQNVKVETYLKWSKELKTEIDRIVKIEKHLSKSIIEFRTDVKNSLVKLDEKKDTLSKLESGEINICTTCGTELTSSLRKHNIDRISNEIKEINEEVTKIESNKTDAENAQNEPSFKNKLEAIGSDHLVGNVQKKLNDIFTLFEGYQKFSEEIGECEAKIEASKVQLKKEWLSSLEKNGNDRTYTQVNGKIELVNLFSMELDRLVQQNNDLMSEKKKVKEIKKAIKSNYNKFKIDSSNSYGDLIKQRNDLQDIRRSTEEQLRQLKLYQSLHLEINTSEKELAELAEIVKRERGKLSEAPFNTVDEDIQKIKEKVTAGLDERLTIASSLSSKKIELDYAKNACKEKEEKMKRAAKLNSFSALATAIAKTFQEIRPKLLKLKTKRIVSRTNEIIRNMPSQADTLRLEVEEEGTKYNLVVFRNGEKGKLNTVSGGELTGLGFALRVAIARELSDVGLLILDEPTYGLDRARRPRLADVLVEQKNIEQLLVVTHDDLFNGKTENITQISQNNGTSRNMAGELGK